MLKNRLIPVVLMRNGVAVQSKGFRRYQPLGNPMTIVERLSDWAADELIYLDISRDDRYDIGRDDLRDANRGEPLAILSDIAERCLMPLTFGGRIRTLGDAAVRIERGADKVAINTAALADPGFIDACAAEFGAQCVVVAIDCRREEQAGGEAGWSVASEGGRTPTGYDPVAWAVEAESRGAGEILLQSIDRDGRGGGYDLGLIRRVSDAVSVPVVALGGAGEWPHLLDGLGAGADAVAAANVLNYTEQSVLKAKRWLYEAGANVREPSLAAIETGAVA